jgi:hypothetical protein
MLMLHSLPEAGGLRLWAEESIPVLWRYVGYVGVEIRLGGHVRWALLQCREPRVDVAVAGVATDLQTLQRAPRGKRNLVQCSTVLALNKHDATHTD